MAAGGQYGAAPAPALVPAPSGAGPLAAAAASWLFGAARRCCDAGCTAAALLRSQRLPVPVIVVGNLTVGGSGKTPLVLWLVERLRERAGDPGSSVAAMVAVAWAGARGGRRLAAFAGRR
jgi:hypothetical protein